MSIDSASWNELREELAHQQAFMEMFTAAWCSDYRRAGGIIHCGRGCSGCCSLAVSCTLTEAVAIAESLSECQAAAVTAHALELRDRMTGIDSLKDYLRMHRREMGGCPLLDADGACGIYPVRPLSCRALISTRENHWCTVDFSELSSEEKRDFVESLDRSVVAFPLHYVASTRDTGQELEGRCLSLMQETFGYSLYGNLPVLLHLVSEHGLGSAYSGAEAAAILQSSGFDHPLLTNLEFRPEGE